MNQDDLLTWQETMQLLGVSSPTLYAIVDDRKELAPAVDTTLGKQRRRQFRRLDVEVLKRKRSGEAQVDSV